MSTNLAGIVTETAERIPDGIAYKLDDTEINWQAVDEGSARVAGLLKEKGLEPGDRVGIMLPNVPYFPIAYYGILRAGGTVVPMNVLLKGREVKFYLEDPEAKWVFAWHDFAEAAEKGAEEAGSRGRSSSSPASSSSCSATPSRRARSPSATAPTPR